jgi:hypothetical protein
MNVAGLTRENLARVAAGIADVQSQMAS